ncbi:MAG: flavin reductase family protein [Rhodobacteraceae bacterium]|nr:flavin reductase family protein [Paracoccaceae bacterium]
MSEMWLDFEELTPTERYKLLTATVTPRPIALVSSLGPDGVLNAAPFSFFNVFAEDPALLMIGLNKRSDGAVKHTAENILQRREFVVNLIDEAIAEAMARCAAELPQGVSELSFAGLTSAEPNWIKTPRIAEAPFSFECRLHQHIKVSEERDLILGVILGMSARDGLIDTETLRLVPSRFHPVGRLYANHYSRQRDRFDLDVPKVAPADGVVKP